MLPPDEMVTPPPPPTAVPPEVGCGEGVADPMSGLTSLVFSSLWEGLSGLAFWVFVLLMLGGSTVCGSMAVLSFCMEPTARPEMGDVLAEVVGVTAFEPLADFMAFLVASLTSWNFSTNCEGKGI